MSSWRKSKRTVRTHTHPQQTHTPPSGLSPCWSGRRAVWRAGWPQQDEEESGERRILYRECTCGHGEQIKLLKRSNIAHDIFLQDLNAFNVNKEPIIASRLWTCLYFSRLGDERLSNDKFPFCKTMKKKKKTHVFKSVKTTSLPTQSGP